MFSNNFKIAFRNLWRKKAFSAINILGLATGIATCLLIMLYVNDELSFDQYNKKADRIVRVVFKGVVQGQQMKEANVMPPTAQALLHDYPEVQDATRMKQVGSILINNGEKSFKETRMAVADPNFFQVFTLPLLQGDPKTALSEPNGMVITSEIADKYFGTQDVIGKTLKIKSWNADYKITGVMKAVPTNSHFHFDFFTSLVGDKDAHSDSWMRSSFYTYLLLKPGVDYKKLEAKLPATIEKYIGPQMQEGMGMSLAEFRKNGNNIGLYLQRLTDIHLHSDLMPISELEPPADVRYVYIFSAIAIFMLLIACINFMNLSTAGASKRAREVGIRKVLGSVKSQLIRQFLMESLLLSVIALSIAVVLVYIALPGFNTLSGKNISFNLFTNPTMLIGLLSLGIITGFLAGSYPAFFLSSFNPITVLKGKLSSGKGSISLRSGLVVFQFFISISLIIGTIVVYKQLNFIQNTQLGYDKESVIIVPETWYLGNNQSAFKEELRQDPRILSVSSSDYLPAGASNWNNFFLYDREKADQVKTLRFDVDYDYLSTLGMQIREGRNFSRDFATDSTGILLNEAAAKTFGWSSNAIGKELHWDNEGKSMTFRVIGVVKDFHFRSLHEKISPLVMTLALNSGNVIIKAKTKDISGLLGSMKKEWENLKAETPFNYSFLDDRFYDTYKAEQRIGLILLIFAGLTVFVACLGLYGLATFTAEQRSKEIGIRKVLGATVNNVVQLLSKDFLKLVVIANLIAWPVAWWAMNAWIQDFEYRITIGWWVFALAAVLAIIITIVSVGFHAVKAALMNPVDSLKVE